MESLLINRSAIVDPKIYIPRLSDEPVNLLKNNYAPLENRLADSMNTRRIYPTARYLTSKPPLTDMSTAVADLSRKMENNSTVPTLDRVNLIPTTDRIFDSSVVIPDQLHQTESELTMNNSTMINSRTQSNNPNAFSRVAEKADRSAIARSSASSTASTVSSTLADYISMSSQQPTHHLSSRVPTGQGPMRVSDMNRMREANRNAREGFLNKRVEDDGENSILDEMYLTALRSRIVSVLDFIKQTPDYSYWNDNWREMERNLSRSGSITFERLETSDSDAAFVISKGEEKKIKIRARDFKYVPINISQYVLYHECAHLANFEYGHGKKFRELLALLCLAAFQLEFIRLERMPDSVYTLDGVPILSKDDMKHEILDGVRAIQSVAIMNSDYYDALATFVESF